MRNRRFIYSFFLILFIVSIYGVFANLDSIYAELARFYYKGNNVTKAQYFFEKSFSLGNKNFANRDMYLNLIINTPLTLESQEKLINLAEGDIQDQVSQKAKDFLHNLKLEINSQYPNNYINQAPFNQRIVRWNKFPITYSYKNAEQIPEGYIEEINNAFKTWERSGDVLFSEVSGDSDIVIVFKNNQNREIEYGKKYVMAYTVPQITSKELQQMDIIFYIQDPEGKSFTKNQIYNTALHEIFHALGFMGHSFNSEDIMFLSKDSSDFINDARIAPTGADINTLKLLYKIKPDITNEGDLESDYLPYLVLGDDNQVSLSKSKEAKNYISHAPSLPGGYIDLAESLVAQEHYPEAIKSLEKALSLADTNDMRYIIFYNLAVSYFYIDHKEMALEYIEKAKNIKNLPELQFLKAEIILKSDKKSGIGEYVKLIEQAPDNPEYVIRLANLYIKEHKYWKARRILKKFLDRNPSHKNNEKFSSYGILLF